MFGAAIAGDDFLGAFGPGEGFGVFIAVVDPVFDCSLEFRHAGKCPPPDALDARVTEAHRPATPASTK